MRFALMLSGCVTIPDAIKGSSPTPQQDLVRVMNAPQLYIGQEARFGGKVVAVQNQQGKTRLEIATVPLDSGARPVLGEASRGRIFADVNGFLDPVDFRGQLVTVVGPITGTVDGKIGNTPYKFMLMQATGYKRWHLVQQVVMPPQPIDPWFYGGRAGLMAMAVGDGITWTRRGSDDSNRVTLCFINKRNSGWSCFCIHRDIIKINSDALRNLSVA